MKNIRLLLVSLAIAVACILALVYFAPDYSYGAEPADCTAPITLAQVLKQERDAANDQVASVTAMNALYQRQIAADEAEIARLKAPAKK